MRPKPRRRRVHPMLALRRQPRLWWLLTVTVALAVGWVVSTIVAEAERTRLAWGTTELVAVASRHLAAGTTIEAGDVELEERPGALVPDGALDGVPEGQIAAVAIE